MTRYVVNKLFRRENGGDGGVQQTIWVIFWPCEMSSDVAMFLDLRVRCYHNCEKCMVNGIILKV